jgi:hypothetical protein
MVFVTPKLDSKEEHFICDHHGVPKISIIAHSWGTIAPDSLAGERQDAERAVSGRPTEPSCA